MNKVSNDTANNKISDDNASNNNVNNNVTNDNFEFDFAMCHGSYFYCRYTRYR